MNTSMWFGVVCSCCNFCLNLAVTFPQPRLNILGPVDTFCHENQNLQFMALWLRGGRDLDNFVKLRDWYVSLKWPEDGLTWFFATKVALIWRGQLQSWDRGRSLAALGFGTIWCHVSSSWMRRSKVSSPVWSQQVSKSCPHQDTLA